MKRSEPKSKNSLASRCLAMLTVLSTVSALILPAAPVVGATNGTDTIISSTVPEESEDESTNTPSTDSEEPEDENTNTPLTDSEESEEENTIMPLSVPETAENLLAWIDFNGSGPVVLSGRNDVQATIENGTIDSIIGTEELSDGTTNTYLDLTGSNAYLSLDGNILKNMSEVTVEMRLKVKKEGSSGAQWAFYAAPNDDYPTGKERYLSVHINPDTNEVFARRYAGSKPSDEVPNKNGIFAQFNTDEDVWYTVKVIYEARKTTISVTKDGAEAEVSSTTTLNANIWDCVQDNNVLWFGKSAYGEYFNGCIDDIRIWGTRKDFAPVTAEVEKKYIITKNIIDPENTTVNMFDYWVYDDGDQIGQDYGYTYDRTDDLINGGINNGHLFLFDGSASFDAGNRGPNGDSPSFGSWNKYVGTESRWGIVQNTLDSEGYPQLALYNWSRPENGILGTLWDTNSGKRTESLKYLFNPETSNADKGKASYPDVTGLFRIDEDGYYYFRSQEVFAELNADQPYDPDNPQAKYSTNNNKITLYDNPWMVGDIDSTGSARGQFFPFNDWTDLFYELNGNAWQKGNQGDQIEYGQPLNHWFGMSIETKFIQLMGGQINNAQHMIFEFSGDDDVWIFIDDVLVADVGGVHNRIFVTIDFATGEIVYKGRLSNDGVTGGYSFTPTDQNTLLKMFQAAGKQDETSWNGNTFANGTVHTLKFFYLERGNADSNCNIRFNLADPIMDRIRKVDENGKPLEGVVFDLYAATANSTINDREWWHTADEFTAGNKITTATSDEKGYALLEKGKDEPLDLSRSTYYILRETATPPGYRQNKDIVLKYQEETGTLIVVNKYEVGAYASFLASWTSPLNIYPAAYNGNGTFTKGNDNIPDSDLSKGLAVVVPVVNKGGKWQPMYGSNTLGWNTVTPVGNDENSFKKALLEAAIRQITDTETQDWYLSWNGAQLKGQMENLPGDATRYLDGADGKLVTLFLPESALTRLGLEGSYDNDERYEKFSDALAKKGAENAVSGISGLNISDLKILYTDNFKKNNRSVIYVSNEQRELRVRKVNPKGEPLKGAVFALLDSNNVEIVRGTTGTNGELIFRAKPLADSEAETGYAKMEWDSSGTTSKTYWLKEITAPSDDYELNASLVRIEVGNAGIYANATGFDSNKNPIEGYDGIKVEASPGRLTQTLVKYAEGNVDETLKYITVTEQSADSDGNGKLDINSWHDANDAKTDNLVYDSDEKDYVTIAAPVTFEAENGYIRIMPRQTKDISEAPTAKRDTLTDNSGNPIDLDGLFCLINTVVVTDTRVPGNLKVSKIVAGEGADTNKEFEFTVTLNDKTINGKYGDMTFKDGVATFKLRDGESATAIGIPSGTKYKVTEASYGGYKRETKDKSGKLIEFGSDLSIPKKDTSEVNVTNTYIPGTGNLTVSETVKPADGKTDLTEEDKDREFTFTVTLDDDSINGTYGDMTFKDGVAEVTLKDGESATATGLPAGTKYTVTQTSDDDYELIESTGTEGTIVEGETAEAEFTNKPKLPGTGNLTVSEIVRAKDGTTNLTEDDENEVFEFTVTLTDKTINGKYGDMTFENGVAKFTLKHGESATATGLPDGVGYTVTQTYNDEYGLVSVTGATGTIKAGETAKAQFVNQPGAPGNGGNPGNSTGTGGTNKPAENVSSGSALYEANEEIGTVIASSAVVVLIIFAAAALVFILKKKKI